MDSKAILGTLTAIFFISILFFPQESNNWKWMLFIGIILGTILFFKK